MLLTATVTSPTFLKVLVTPDVTQIEGVALSCQLISPRPVQEWGKLLSLEGRASLHRFLVFPCTRCAINFGEILNGYLRTCNPSFEPKSSISACNFVHLSYAYRDVETRPRRAVRVFEINARNVRVKYRKKISVLIDDLSDDIARVRVLSTKRDLAFIETLANVRGVSPGFRAIGGIK